jgi:hypothetical protein
VRAFRLTPNPVASGETLKFSLALTATAPTQLAEVAILIYSSLVTRIAIIDLRTVSLPTRLDAGQTWTVEGSIASVHFVEGDYRFGIFVNSSDFVGDVTDLVELSVQARPHTGHLVPYAAAHRGIVELDVEISS